MTQVVEDGTGLPNADSYDSVANVKLYLASTGYAQSWSAYSVPRQEELIKSATRMIDGSFNFRGCLKRLDQNLSFPRVGLQDREGREITGIPMLLKIACAELAYHLAENNYLEDAELASLNKIRVGPISLEVSDMAKITKNVPDSVIRSLTEYGYYRYGRRRMRELHLG